MYALIFLLYSLTFAVHTDEGPIIDPNGSHITTYSDEGPGMCPHGGHGGGTASVQSDVGSTIDPNG
jgi:hypothetical protein